MKQQQQQEQQVNNKTKAKPFGKLRWWAMENGPLQFVLPIKICSFSSTSHVRLSVYFYLNLCDRHIVTCFEDWYCNLSICSLERNRCFGCEESAFRTWMSLEGSAIGSNVIGSVGYFTPIYPNYKVGGITPLLTTNPKGSMYGI